MKNKEINLLNKGDIIGHPTDTVFGLIVKMERKNIQKINKLKLRDKDQPIQILFGSLEQAIDYLGMDIFSIKYLRKNIRNKTSYLVNSDKNFQDKYLNKELDGTVLFRVPDRKLINIIKHTGPLFATSANIHNKKPINSNYEVEKIFRIFVSSEKQKGSKDSKIISLIGNKVEVIRE